MCIGSAVIDSHIAIIFNDPGLGENDVLILLRRYSVSDLPAARTVNTW